ncbi:hypothetical protein [Companilactobacillus sp. HBUAS59699]|uniref:hypothetical protein n=1 Tax=Companilactobacillus sp. HBUAS59699 TaxID=3109358 RepID=UPI002FF3788A
MIRNNIQTVNAATQDVNIEVKPKAEPSEDVKKFMGIWLNRGYTVQPPEVTFTVTNHTTHLVTHSGRSTLGITMTPFAVPRYQWYKSTDKGEHWTEMSKQEGGNQEDLHLPNKEAGVTHYQQQVNWRPVGGLGFPFAEIWSKVATVLVNEKDKNADKIEVSVDDDYLYNNPSEIALNSTVARAKVTPEDYTEDIVWSVDNNQLAYIDKETGELHANSRGVSGIVTVTGTIKNADGSVVSDSTKVRIGGGLDDRQVKSGEPVQFEMLGNIGQWDEKSADFTIRWYRQPAGTNDRELVESNKKELMYKIEEPRVKNNNDLYWIEISMKFGRDSYEYITNKAKLNVLPADSPEVTLSNSVSNETFNNNNTDDTLNDIANGDKVLYNDEVRVGSESVPLRDGKYVLPLYRDTIVEGVNINGEELNSKQYHVEHLSGDDTANLIINDINCDAGKKLDIKILTTVGGVTSNKGTETQPYIFSYKEDNSYRFLGAKKNLNYVINALQKNVRDINYGSIHAYSKDELISRTDDTNKPNDIVSVDDQRRVKEQIKVFVNQENEFMDEKGNVLPGHIRLYDNGNYEEIMGKKVKVVESKENEPLQSIGFDKENGPLLYIDEASVPAGKYSTTLTWSFESCL